MFNFSFIGSFTSNILEISLTDFDFNKPNTYVLPIKPFSKSCKFSGSGFISCKTDKIVLFSYIFMPLLLFFICISSSKLFRKYLAFAEYFKVATCLISKYGSISIMVVFSKASYISDKVTKAWLFKILDESPNA